MHCIGSSTFLRCAVRACLVGLFCLAISCGPLDSADQVSDQTQSPARQPADAVARHPDPEPEGKASGRENRLAKETSPYLLLHKHNPVDWFPWGEEALDKAKKEKKLIFLSVGYSSCYWCHVMERESFSDEEIAKYLNEHFVCVKVDREERPDIDEIYMNSLHAYQARVGMPSRGGWPLSMFLTPEARPIGGFTYLPPREDEERGLMGFFDVAQRVQGMWEKSPEDLREQGVNLAEDVKTMLAKRAVELGDPPGAKQVEQLQKDLKEQFDPEHGGFSYDVDNPQQPKFPEPSNLLFLIERSRRLPEGADRDEAQKLVVDTLNHMAAGGIRDHLGGGFHRYSTDRFWRIPHFEKMLYDNGQLASVYAEAFALTGNADYKRVVEQLLEFVLRELTSEAGGFYSALDAETEAEEGAFYVWKVDELKDLLSDEEYQLFAAAYGVDAGPNFEGKSTLLLPRSLDESAELLKLPADDLLARLTPIREKLLAAREKRPRPLLDTKILTSWNGLMIRGFADAGRILEEERYVQAAARAADFVLANLRGADGRLLRTHTAGEAKLNAYLDDYAFFVDGLIALHKATSERKWLDAAAELTGKQIELFWDEKNGAFFFTSSDHEDLIARSKGQTDGAEPAGNSLAAANLLYLSAALEQPELRERAEKSLRFFGLYFDRAPAAFPRMAIALIESLEPAGK